MQFLESKWCPNDIKGQGQWPSFSIPPERIPRCIFGANYVILAQIHYKLCRQPKFHRIPSQNGQNDIEGKVNDLHFQYQLRVSQDACLVNLAILAQICDELSHGQAEFRRILSQNDQNDIEGQGQWPPFSIPTKSIPGCMFRANWMILAQICDELPSGQAEFTRILSQNGQNDLEGKGQWPPFSMPAESTPGCMFGAYLVILAPNLGRVIVRTSRIS